MSLLKIQGFKKGRGFYRFTNNVWHVINLQKSRHKPGSFTVNIGVASHSIIYGLNNSLLLRRKLDSSNFCPDIASCVVSHRLGELMGKGDLWWEVDSTSAEEEVVGAIQELALPWLALFRNETAIRDDLLRKDSQDE